MFCISRTWLIVLFHLICKCWFVYLEHDLLYCSIWFVCVAVYIQNMIHCTFISKTCSIWFVCVVLYIQNMIHCTVPSNLYVLLCISRTWFIVLFHLICMCCCLYPKHDSLYCSIWFVCVVLYIQNMIHCTVPSDLYVLFCISRTWFIVLFPLICMCCFVYLEHDSLYCSIWFVCVVLYIQNMIHCTVPSNLYVLFCISRTWLTVLFPLICMCCLVYLEHDCIVLFYLICMCCFVYPEHDCIVLYIYIFIWCSCGKYNFDWLNTYF